MIKLIKGYPYDNTYDYIKLHANKTEQENYFNTFDYIFDEIVFRPEGFEIQIFFLEYRFIHPSHFSIKTLLLIYLKFIQINKKT